MLFSAATTMSNSASFTSDEAVSFGSLTSLVNDTTAIPLLYNNSPPQPQKVRKKRSLPGNPDPDAEVIALSPKTLLATNRFVCEICNKGFQRDQNLQLHRRGHNLPWKLKQRNNKDGIIKKKAYVCPEPTCVHHHPSRALGDLTGIKKHFCRKHGEKKWKCEKCSKIYAVQSDWKAHSKTCGTREYRCDCGTLFSRKDSFVTHRAFCDALAEESARLSATLSGDQTTAAHCPAFPIGSQHNFTLSAPWTDPNSNPNQSLHFLMATTPPTSQVGPQPPSLSATALLQKATSVGNVARFDLARCGNGFGPAAAASVSNVSPPCMVLPMWQKSSGLTRDFLGLAGEDGIGDCTDGDTASFELQRLGYDRLSLFKAQGYGFAAESEGPQGTCWRDC